MKSLLFLVPILACLNSSYAEETIIEEVPGDHRYDASEYKFPEGEGIVSEILCTGYQTEGPISQGPMDIHGKFGLYIKTTPNTFTPEQIAEGKVEPIVGQSEVVVFSIEKTPAQYASEVHELRDKQPCEMFSIHPEVSVDQLVKDCTYSEAFVDLERRGIIGSPKKENYAEFIQRSSNLDALIQTHRQGFSDFIPENADFHVIASRSFDHRAFSLFMDGLQSRDEDDFYAVYGKYEENFEEPEESDLPQREKLNDPMHGFTVMYEYKKAVTPAIEDENGAGIIFLDGRRERVYEQNEQLKDFSINPVNSISFDDFDNCSYICADCAEAETE
jgi:hypothetical protein